MYPKILSGIQSGSQTVWAQIRMDILSILIWVQTVFKGQKLSLAKKELKLKISTVSNFKYLHHRIIKSYEHLLKRI